MKYGLYIIFLIISTVGHAQVQDDLLNELGGWEEADRPEDKTFRGTKIINMPSVENPYVGELIFSIGHRFGNIRSGVYEVFGLDQATIRLGLDYGINSWLAVGVGRSTFEKTYDSYMKARLIRQRGKLDAPVSLVYYFSGTQSTQRHIYPTEKNNFPGRLSLVQSMMLSRKFSEKFSIQINPIWLHSNYLKEIQKQADVFFMGMATRVQLSPITHLNIEYIPEITDLGISNTNPLSVGFDIETGGHVFQLFFSNSQGIHDKAYLINTTGSWGRGDIFFGFSITRVFYL